MIFNKLKKSALSLFEFFTNRLYFCVIYLMAASFRSVIPLRPVADPMMKLCLVWGVGMLIWDFFGKRDMFKGYRCWLLVLFLVLNVLTLLTSPVGLFAGIKQLLYNAILLLIFYPAKQDCPIEKQKKVFCGLGDFYIIAFTVVSAVSIVMYLMNVSRQVEIGGVTFNLGIAFNRLAGIYTNSNTGATVSPLVFAMMLLNRVFNKRHFRRMLPVYIPCGLIQFVYYTLTLSNGGQLAFLGFIAAVCLFIVFPWFLRKYRTVLSLVLTAAVLCGSVALFYGGTYVSRTVVVSAANSINNHRHHHVDPDDPDHVEDPDQDEDVDEIVLERVEKDTSLDNGRKDIWSAGIATLKQKMILGWGDATFYDGDVMIITFDESVLTEAQLKMLKDTAGHLHNAFVQIAVCGGIAALLVIVIFTILIAKKYLSALFSLAKSPYYFSVAAVMCLIVLLLSQTAAEAHLLYVHHDPFACIFWLYLGFGIRLIAHGEKNTARDFAFMCDTPLQVMNAVSFVESNEMGSKDCSDVFIYHQFKGSEELAERLRAEGVFRNVYDFSKIDFKEGAAKKLTTLIRVFMPRTHLKKIYRGDKADFLKNNYKYLVLSFYTPFSDLLHLSFANTDTVQLEDGLGSYITPDLEQRYRSGLFEKINRYVMNGRLSYNPRCLYLANPELCIDQPLPLRNLASIASNDQLLTTAGRVFDYKENPLYAERHAVLLGQPLYDRAEAECIRRAEAEMAPILAEKDVLVRLHPRQTEHPFGNLAIDTVGNMWELECANHIGDNHILMGAFSTAQFVPKMMFDKEPTLVFLYRLMGCEFDNAQQMIDTIRSVYRDKSKIRTPETMEELTEILNSL